MLQITRDHVRRYRLFVNNLTARMGVGEYVAAARYALQDSAPRSGLISLHARVTRCEASAWEHSGLAQTYSPRAAVHLIPRDDFGIFTIGRLPADPAACQEIEADAEEVCRVLGDRSLRTWQIPKQLHGRLRRACATGRIEIRWDARSLAVRSHPRPGIGYGEASLELARRHLHSYGPTDPGALARWSGVSPADARRVWARLAHEVVEVDVDGRPAWLHRHDEDTLATAPRMRGVRFLPAEELRLLDEARPPRYDTFHPHALLVHGQIIGSWGRRRGVVHARVSERIDRRTRESIEAEAMTIPIPGATITLRLEELAA